MRRMPILPVLLIPVLMIAAEAAGQQPVRHEQFVFSIVAFNGRDYSGTFTTEESEAIYLLADEDSFLTANKSFVYFWPITREWRTDTRTLNERVEGRLEISDRRGEQWTIESQLYTYYNIRDDYDQKWVVATGADARAAEREFREHAENYRRRVDAYRDASREYERRATEMRRRIEAERAAGNDVSALIEELSSWSVPVPPEPPGRYVVPPAEVEEAFVLNLPAGEYSIQLVQTDTVDGVERIVQDSTKRIVVFEPRRTDHIGYDVVPGDRWTRPMESSTPESVIYVNGASDLYLRPFFQNEYNDLHYRKLHRNDARGNPGVMRWAHLQQVPRARIDIRTSGGRVESVREAPFFVQQSTGGVPGYTIVPFDGEGQHAERDPSLRAFHVPIDPDDTRLAVTVRDDQGNELTGGTREIRVVDTSAAGNRRNAWLYAVSLLPVGVMVPIRNFRRRRMDRGQLD